MLILFQMAEYWIKYVRRFDLLFEDALRLSLKATMQNVYKLVHGDGMDFSRFSNKFQVSFPQ